MTLEQTYAAALLRAIERGVEVNDATKRLAQVLKARGMQSLLPRIIHSVRTIAAQQATADTVTLIVARKSDGPDALSAAAAYFSQLSISAKEVNVVVDDAIVGGWVLEGRGTRIDESYKRHLVAMYHKAAEAVSVV